MTKIWLELKYGNVDRGGTLLSRIWSRDLLRKAKAKILEDLADRALIDELKDEVQGIIAKSDYKKQKKVLEKLIPDSENGD
tara:strand:- start:24 stop:266 length:243 start_codon:yes stop_codon:yes gene_type:complete